jgi:hypothetical protein
VSGGSRPLTEEPRQQFAASRFGDPGDHLDAVVEATIVD